MGIDHNSSSVEVARSRGHNAFLPAEFEQTRFNSPDTFDGILLSHVAEHMTEVEASSLLTTYLHFLRPQGRVVLITPQEIGFNSDPTHVQFTDFEVLRRIAERNGLRTEKQYSFPFPRFAGRVFKYNEFVSISVKQ